MLESLVCLGVRFSITVATKARDTRYHLHHSLGILGGKDKQPETGLPFRPLQTVATMHVAMINISSTMYYNLVSFLMICHCFFSLHSAWPVNSGQYDFEFW